jgi:small conductance mechanosensitive channel
VRVGDVAVVNGQGGLVEEVNLRTIVLRDMEGAVHVFPNGEVKTLANKSKDFSYYVLDIGIRYDDDPDHAAAALREAGDIVSRDERFRSSILEPLEILGVDAFNENQIVLKARIKTVPLKQWEVGRELRKQIARVMRERGIPLPTRQVTLSVPPELLRGTVERNETVKKP